MARTGITYEDVAAAAAQLLSDGTEPSAAKVRGLLGTGSLNTIQRHLEAWREDRDRAVTEAAAVPDEILPVIERLAGRIWAVADGHARAGLDAARAEMLRRTGAAEDALVEVEERLDAAQADLARQKEATDTADAARLDLQLELTRRDEQLHAAADRVLAFEARAEAAERRAEKAEDRLAKFALEIGRDRSAGSATTASAQGDISV